MRRAPSIAAVSCRKVGVHQSRPSRRNRLAAACCLLDEQAPSPAFLSCRSPMSECARNDALSRTLLTRAGSREIPASARGGLLIVSMAIEGMDMRRLRVGLLGIGKIARDQ